MIAQTTKSNPRKELRNALKLIADKLPQLYYPSNGVQISPDEKMYADTRYSMVNHKRRLRKLIYTARTQQQMEQRVSKYVLSVYQTAAQPKPSWRKRFRFYLAVFINQIKDILDA